MQLHINKHIPWGEGIVCDLLNNSIMFIMAEDIPHITVQWITTFDVLAGVSVLWHSSGQGGRWERELDHCKKRSGLFQFGVFFMILLLWLLSFCLVQFHDLMIIDLCGSVWWLYDDWFSVQCILMTLWYGLFALCSLMTFRWLIVCVLQLDGFLMTDSLWGAA